MSNAAPKSETRGGNSGGPGYGGGGPRGPAGHGVNRGPAGPDGPGMYPQRFNPGPNQGSWGNQGPRGNLDMPNLQALG